MPSRIALRLTATLLPALLLSSLLPAQTIPAAAVDPTALVHRAVHFRLDAAKNHHPLEYLIRRVDERRDSTKLIVETADGNVARLVALNGKPLSPDANQAELDRLTTLAAHPELQERRRKNEQKDADRVTRMLSLLPDAFLYKFEGMVSCSSGQCYRMSFTPNRYFTPPDLESNIFRGIEGELWIDRVQERMTRLDARFIADVDFGFGLIGKINKGGTVLLEQANIGDNDWELTGLKIHVTGKALLVKSFSYQVYEQASHYSPVAPGMHYRDAIDVLKKYDAYAATYTPETVTPSVSKGSK
ncbi:MAG: hypothetical protein M3O31_01720 [Acidobacteriota bacterium]|nr:hypothetical protein [Acidobacteriota bacterium]